MSRFEVLTPFGSTVRTSDEYWQTLIVKHPDVADLETDVKQALATPDEIRQSSRDPNVLLF